MKKKSMIWILVSMLVLSSVFIVGCLDQEDDYDVSVAVTIPPQREWVEAIGGGRIGVTVMVPPGQDPHTYEPKPSQLAELSRADIYFKVGSGLEFEEIWMDTLIAQNKDMTVVDGSKGVPLLDFENGCCPHEHLSTFTLLHDNDYELEIINRGTGEEVAHVHGDHWHGSLPDIELGKHVSLGARFYHNDSDIDLGHDEDHQMNVRIETGDDIVETHSHGDHVHIKGIATGHAHVVFQLMHGDDVAYESPSIKVDVRDHHHHEGTDPHIWLSPVNARTMIENFLEKLIEIDPGNEEYYRENAQAYIDELIEMHDQIEALLEPHHGRRFLIYHPSFNYFAREYGLEQVAIEHEGKEPGPAGLAAIIDQAKDEGITVVFVSPQFDKSNAEAIAAEIGGSVLTLNPLAEDYIDNLMEVALNLIEAFGES